MRHLSLSLLALLLGGSTLSAQSTLYADPQHRFTVQVPQGWTTQDQGDQGVELSGSGLSLVITPLAAGGSHGDALAAMVHQVSSRWQNLKEIDHREIPILGQPAAWTIYEGTDSAGKPQTIRVMGIEGGGVTAGVVTGGERANYFAQRGVVEVILVTLRLGTNTPSPFDGTLAGATAPPASTDTASGTLSLRSAQAPARPTSTGPSIGIVARDIDEGEVDDLGLVDDRGALVDQVQPGRPADREGIRPNDVIVQLDRTEVDGAADYERLLAAHRAGDTVELMLVRHGRKKVVSVRVE